MFPLFSNLENFNQTQNSGNEEVIRADNENKLKIFLYNSFNDPTRSAKKKRIIKSKTIKSTINMKHFAANEQILVSF